MFRQFFHFSQNPHEVLKRILWLVYSRLPNIIQDTASLLKIPSPMIGFRAWCYTMHELHARVVNVHHNNHVILVYMCPLHVHLCTLGICWATISSTWHKTVIYLVYTHKDGYFVTHDHQSYLIIPNMLSCICFTPRSSITSWASCRELLQSIYAPFSIVPCHCVL